MKDINYQELAELKDIFGVSKDNEYEEFINNTVFNPYKRRIKRLSEVNPEDLKLKEF